MGTYVNPGNQAFREIADENYIDKTGLIDVINQKILTGNKLTCISRPRRFGKSYAAKMLTAYYDRSCDSHELFDHRAVAKTGKYEKFINHFNVICLDITGFISEVKSENGDLRTVPGLIKQSLWKDLREEGFKPEEGDTLNDFLLRIANQENENQEKDSRFIFIIDEWDALIREAKDDPVVQEDYLSLLRGWFKNNTFTSKAVAAAYMTGILPIKKDGSQSAISDFREYSIINQDGFAPYTGFTENEVKGISEKYHLPFDQLKRWYDGYDTLESGPMYNPYSVMEAAAFGRCMSFWTTSSASEALTKYIRMRRKGLTEIIARLIAGEEIPVNTTQFQNDFKRLHSTDDVLTLLIHLGYLTYDLNTGKAHIPNEEVLQEFEGFLREDDQTASWVRLIERSEKLYEHVLAGDGAAVAQIIEEIREEKYAPQFNNNEQTLRALIKYAFFAVTPRYYDLQEVPSGKGIADVIFIPRADASDPALVIELKRNESAQKGIRQIEKKKYASILKGFEGRILLVAINYDPKTNVHTCEIREA